jgi:hypothetical protein
MIIVGTGATASKNFHLINEVQVLGSAIGSKTPLLEQKYESPISGFVTTTIYQWSASDELEKKITNTKESLYTHDTKGQLIRWQAPGYDVRYDYDVNGNRKLEGAVYDADNRLLETSNYSYEYDKEGSLIKRVSKSGNDYTTYDYDHCKRLVSVKKYNNNTLTDDIEYQYDLHNRRVLKRINGVIKQQSIYSEEAVWREGMVGPIYMEI